MVDLPRPDLAPLSAVQALLQPDHPEHFRPGNAGAQLCSGEAITGHTEHSQQFQGDHNYAIHLGHLF